MGTSLNCIKIILVIEDAGLECKTAGAYSADKWDDGNIPLHYVMQCYHYMAVTGERTWYIAAVILGEEIEKDTIQSLFLFELAKSGLP